MSQHVDNPLIFVCGGFKRWLKRFILMIEALLFFLCVWLSFSYSSLIVTHGIFGVTYLLVLFYYISIFIPIEAGLFGSVNAMSFILPMLGIPAVFVFSIIGIVSARKMNSHSLLLCHSLALFLSVSFLFFSFI